MPVRVVELFAGVGGFRLGLQNASPAFETVWWNQWEPSTSRVQHAWSIYKSHFHGNGVKLPKHSNVDICKVAVSSIRNHDLLVGGFPCQDYSVATSLDKAGGIHGKKGVLWWEIVRILKAKKPSYLLLENVDRLLKSPANQRGRDFAVLLACLRDLGYVVEWRVVNASDYGCMTRRHRTFIFAARKRTGIGRYMRSNAAASTYLLKDGFFASEFKVSRQHVRRLREKPTVTLSPDVRQISREFKWEFANAGVMVNGKVWSKPVSARREDEAVLGDALDETVQDRYFLRPTDVKEWETVKDAKAIERTTPEGYTYLFAEGKMAFPDSLDRPARTVLTSEGNRTPNRSTHVIRLTDGRHRFLTPSEVERLMGFEPGWTAIEGVPDRWRYFTMGNALVVPLVTRMGSRLLVWIQRHESQSRKERFVPSARGPRRVTPPVSTSDRSR